MRTADQIWKEVAAEAVVCESVELKKVTGGNFIIFKNPFPERGDSLFVSVFAIEKADLPFVVEQIQAEFFGWLDE